MRFRNTIQRLFFASISLIAIIAQTGEAQPLSDSQMADANRLCEAALETESKCDLNRAFAGLWLGRDLPRANADLLAAYGAILGGSEEMTPELADAKAKWQMRTWVRIYYLFAEDSKWFPGWLESELQQRVEDLLWNYAFAKSFLDRANPEYVWLIQGSENHDMMDLGNAFLALQAAANNPRFADRSMADGHTQKEHLQAWTEYFTLYCKERVKHGLFIEIASPTYGKYFIPEWVNVHDFTEDADLRLQAENLLHLTWADWAVEQLDGVRGGGKTRCYQGNYSRRGESDSWRVMGQMLLKTGDWANAAHFSHPIMGYGFVMATSRYTLPKTIRNLALSPGAREEYAYISRRPGGMKPLGSLPPLDHHSCWYNMDSRNSRLVRYTWCTPDHIMGCFFVDPSLGDVFKVEPENSEEVASSYAAISSQNRWQGIVFASEPNARIFPQGIGTPDKKHPDRSITYSQQVAVQHENVLIVQLNRTNPVNKGMRVFFSPGMKDRIEVRDGWMFLKEGESYAAVRALSRNDGCETCDTSWDNDSFLRIADPHAPIVFVMGRTERFPELLDFEAFVYRHRCEVENGILNYTFGDRSNSAMKLTLYLNESRIPERNGIPLDLAPRKVYDCPFIQSENGSGVVSILFREDLLTLDVN